MRILFVDDEPAILEGLRQALYRQRHIWRMHFAGGVLEAQSVLDAEPIDLLLTDMRMPQHDGAELLAWTRRQHPEVARVLLSGHADAQDVVRALPHLHQSLAKPASADQIVQVAARIEALNHLLPERNLRALAGRLAELPSLGRGFHALQQALAGPDVAIPEIVALLSQDAILSARILQLVNSAYFGLPGRISTLQHAVSWLGLELIRGLAVSVHLQAALERFGAAGAALRKVQDDAERTARLAVSLADEIEQEQSPALATTALLHDIGRIILLAARWESAEQVALADVDIDRWHAEVGGYLLGLWGLPLEIVEAVAFHHRPSRLGRQSTLLAILHAAQSVADAKLPTADGGGLDLAYLQTCGLDQRVQAWLAQAARSESVS